MADGRHIENRLLAISQPVIYRINAKFCRIKQNHVLTQVIWPKYHISKIQDVGPPPFWKWFYRYVSLKSSDFNEIWYADADCASKMLRLLNKILKFCKLKTADGRHIENRLLAISTIDYRIIAKFCRVKQNNVLTQDTWPKYQISKTQEGGRPPFWKWFLSL